MKFFAWFVVATLVFVLIARFKPQAPAEPIIPTGTKEAQGNPESDKDAPPARSEEQGEADAQKGGSSFVVPGFRPAAA